MKKKAIIFTVVALVAVGLIFVPSMLVGHESDTGMKRDRNEESVFSVRTEDANVQTLQAYIEVNGDIVTENEVAIVPDAGGKIVSTKVKLGDTVKKGQLVAEIDPSKPGTSYSLSPVYAPISGTIVSTPLAIGSTVATTTTITTVSVMNDLEIEALIPEREVGQLKVGLKAEVILEAFPGEVFNATVTRVSPVVDPNSRTKMIIIKFNNNDSRITSGMFAKIKLNTRIYNNVVTIPSDSIVELRGSKYVYVMDNTNYVSLREVTTGITVDNMTEIKNGLAAGESVVTQGQQVLADGVLVKVLNTTTRGQA